MKNNHKLIMENWRKYLTENLVVAESEDEVEQLEESIKSVLASFLMFMSTINPARAIDIDVNGHRSDVKVMAQKLQQDGSMEAAQIAQKIAAKLKKGDGDLDGNDILDASELGLNFDEAEFAEKLIKQPDSPDKPKAEKEFDVRDAVKKGNQRASDAASDKLGIPRDATGTGT